MLGINQKAKKTETKTAPAVGENIDARTKEVKISKKEAAAEKKKLANMDREQKVRDKESKRKVREANGGMGVKILLFNKKSKATNVKPKKIRSGVKKKYTSRKAR